MNNINEMKRCIMCNEEAPFIKGGWFNKSLPVCKKHNEMGVAYGHDMLPILFNDIETLTTKFPDNIIENSEQR